MGLTLGSRFGRYDIIGVLGSGGMGEVYRARDAKLGRDVAIKVLSGPRVADPERLQRFEREARVLASLTHPHIGQIFGTEEADGVFALVLELVEGESLEDRLAQAARDRARLPATEAFAIARQIADALDAAHQKGVVHRDLKPANVKVTPEGVVKVLDFGIAKALIMADVIADEKAVATVTADATGTEILGTVAYMSPEQASGRRVDARTDIWAFGCVLFEMLAGRRPFQGATTWETVAAVLERDPPWDALPSSLPPRVGQLLRRCLQKDPRHRLHAIADARIELEELAHDRSRPAAWSTRDRPFARMRPRTVGTTAAAIVLMLAAIAIYLAWDRSPALPRYSNPRQVTAAMGLEDYPASSPDGRTVAFESNQSGNWDIWIAQVDGGRAVNRTADHPGEDRYPSWSPDGSQIAFWSDREGGGYFLMPAVGGSATKIVSTPGTNTTNIGPAAWSADGHQLAFASYTPVGRALQASLDILNVVTRETRRLPLPGTQEARLDLAWSPDGRLVAYVDAGQQPAETTQIMVTRVADGTSRAVTDDRANARSPRWSVDGRELYFVWNHIGAADLWRRRIDESGTPAGEPEQVTTGLEMLHASFSTAGDRLMFAKGRWMSNVWRVPVGRARPATWADATQVTFEHAFIEFVDVSPDGRTLAFSSDRAGNQDLWTLAIDTGDLTQLTTDPAPEWAPRWSPDGRELAFYASRSGDREIYVMPAGGGPARRLTTSPGLDATPDWSPDGKWIAFRSERTGSSDIWVVSADGREERPIAPDAAPDYAPSWSRDGAWIAFGSHRGGQPRLWRAPFPEGAPEPVVAGALFALRWSHGDGRIYYGGTDHNVSEIWSIAPGEQAPKRLATLTGRRGSIGSQPPAIDARYVYFPWREDPADIWVMDVRK